MSDSIGDFLANLYGEPPKAEAPAAEPEPLTVSVVPQPDLEAPAFGPGGWPVDAAEPGEPCSACASLEKWQDIQGNGHCSQCEAGKLARSLKLAEKAADLRRRTPSRQPRTPNVARIAMQAAGPTPNTSGTSGDSAAVCGASQWRQDR